MGTPPSTQHFQHKFMRVQSENILKPKTNKQFTHDYQTCICVNTTQNAHTHMRFEKLLIRQSREKWNAAAQRFYKIQCFSWLWMQPQLAFLALHTGLPRDFCKVHDKSSICSCQVVSPRYELNIMMENEEPNMMYIDWSLSENNSIITE